MHGEHISILTKKMASKRKRESKDPSTWIKMIREVKGDEGVNRDWAKTVCVGNFVHRDLVEWLRCCGDAFSESNGVIAIVLHYLLPPILGTYQCQRAPFWGSLLNFFRSRGVHRNYRREWNAFLVGPKHVFYLKRTDTKHIHLVCKLGNPETFSEWNVSFLAFQYGLSMTPNRMSWPHLFARLCNHFQLVCIPWVLNSDAQISRNTIDIVGDLPIVDELETQEFISPSSGHSRLWFEALAANVSFLERL